MRTTSILICGLLAAAPLARAQQQEQAEEVRLLPGLRLNSISTYIGADSLLTRELTDDGGSSGRWLGIGGAALDVSWNIPGRRNRALLHYAVSYSANHRYSAMNGFNHAFAMNLRMAADRRTSFTLDATLDSSIMATAIFGPSRALRLVQAGWSFDQFANGLADLGGVWQSATDMALSGTRLTTGTASAGIDHVHSPRLAWSARLGATRVLPARSRDLFPVTYPSSTLAMANTTMNYALSRRLQVTTGATYTRSLSHAFPFRWGTATAGLQGLIGRRAFAHVEGGYGRMDGLEGQGGRNSYVAGGGMGVMAGGHTLAMSIHRGIANTHGVGTGSTIGAEASWGWSRPAVPWTLGASVSYEWLTGSAAGRVGGWMYHANVARRLSRNFQLVFDGAYIRVSAPVVQSFEGGGFRMSCVWTPGPAPELPR